MTRSRAAATKTADEMNAPAKRPTAPQLAASRRAKADVEDSKKPGDSITGVLAKIPPQNTSKAASTTTAARRRIKVTPLDAPASEEKPAATVAADKPTAKKSKSSAKERKEPKNESSIPDDQQESKDAEIAAKPKTRRKAAVDATKVDETQPVTKTRGRPKRVIVTESIEEPQQQQPVRQTRTRAGSGAAATQATAASTAKATAAARKKVTFQDFTESDKENRPLVTKRLGPKGQGVTAASGLHAKPVRKPATVKGRKASGGTKQTVSEESRPTPLSPKKVMQVAKSSSPGASDEDELSGAKTPVRDFSQSPKRRAPLAASVSPVKKLEFGTALLSKSPEKDVKTTILMSPARKLPASPFKDALKESPKRGEGALIFPSSALKATTVNAMPAPASQPQSFLLQSPKRGALDSSIFTQSAIKPLKSPAKPTLMQSPPKRLFPSSKGPGSEATPARPSNVPSFIGGDVDTEHSDVMVSCTFRASQSPERSMRVHKVSSEDLALGAPGSIDFDESVLDVRSPIKVSKCVLSPLQGTNEEAESLPVFSADLSPARMAPDVLMLSPYQHENDCHSRVDIEPMEGVMNFPAAEEEECGPASTGTAARKDASSFLFRSARFQDDEESSEDELQADITTFRSTQTATPGVSAKNARSRVSTVNPAETSRNVGFTPLAAQLSSWLATSPDKILSKHPRQHGLFSPLAAQHVPGKVQISRQSTPRRRSGSSRSSRAAFGSADHCGTISVRKSYVSDMAISPEKSSYFADEMAIKDFENEVGGEQSSCEVDEKSPEVYADVEVPAVVAEESLAAVLGLEAGGPDDAALLEQVSDNVQTQDNEDTETASAAAHSSPAETEAEVERDLPATNLGEPVLQTHAEPSKVSDDMNRPDHEVEDVAHEATRQPTSSWEEYATPSHQSTLLSRFANTVVSKVPLRPEGYISPIKISKKRSRSLSAGPSPAKKPIFAPSLILRSNTAASLSPERQATSPAPETPGQQSFMIDDFGDSTLDGVEIDEDDENLPPTTPSAVIRSAFTTPARSPMKAVRDGVLQGAVVFVDVHTTEGADASGIFVELLNQMGARCVRLWNWNPRAGIAGGEMETENVTPSGSAEKVGVTHVVYKDGGKRTLEKVRDAGGIVRCVGVGWVLEWVNFSRSMRVQANNNSSCERENEWLDEAPYAVDASLLPRGGSRRRKSMEPRALINMNGSISAAKGRRSVSAEMTPAMKAELVATPVRAEVSPLQRITNDAMADAGDESAFGSLDSSFSTPTGVQAAFAASTASNTNAAAFATPTGHVNCDPSNEMSPTTPYYLSQGARLVQQTCPPKQTQKGLFDTESGSGDRRATGPGFPVTGKIEDQPDESVRARLEAARRRTMNWRPRVASPLGR